MNKIVAQMKKYKKIKILFLKNKKSSSHKLLKKMMMKIIVKKFNTSIIKAYK